MRVVIVEDSRLARLELKELLRAHPALTLVGEAANVPDAKVLIEQQQPDLCCSISIWPATAPLIC